MKKISEAQDEESALRRLAAQRQLYSEAKTFQFFHLTIAVPMTVIVFTLAVVFPSFQEFATIWGIVLVLIDIWLFSRTENALHLRAAKIQELFDCDVLNIPWNDLKCRSKPDPEDIAEHSGKYLKKTSNFDELKKWYSPEANELPLFLSRIVCQRSNVTWESRLRRRYATGITVLMTFLVLAIVSIGFARNLSINSILVNLVVPLLPAFAWGIPQIMKNLDAVKDIDSLKEAIDKIWDNAFSLRLSKQELADAARSIQDEIYDHRRSKPLVFDWIYSKFRLKDETLMNQGTSELVREALQLLYEHGGVEEAKRLLQCD